MGGSGGFFSSDIKPSDLRRQVADAEDEVRDDRFETEVSNLVDSILTEVNKRDVDLTQKRLTEILDVLAKDIEGSVSLLFGGSIAKHTYVDGLSDVDALVILNKSELEDLDPASVRSYFADVLRNRFGKNAVREGDLAVTVSFPDREIQLLPALRRAPGLSISSADGSRWSPTVRPDRFAAKLTHVNQRLNSKLVPTIKIARIILSQLPAKQQLRAYHVESLAIRVFDGYEGPQTTKAMLRHFFTEAPAHLPRPIRDSTGQSVHVDDYLGRPNTLARRIVADSVGRIGRSIENADRARSCEQWRDILGSLCDSNDRQ